MPRLTWGAWLFVIGLNSALVAVIWAFLELVA